MPLQIICPHCAATFKVADTMRDKKVRCKNCEEVFVVKEDRAPAADEDEAEPDEPRRKRVAPRVQVKAKPSSPAVRRRAAPDNEERDTPRRRPKKAAKKQKGPP